MCTVTWFAHPEGYSLWVNRDERRVRPPAEPPQLRQVDGMAALLPRDPQGGGTWVSVNAAGLALSLLNDHRFTPPEPTGGWVSRGQLVLQLAGLPTPQAVARRLGETPLERFRPFQLLVLGEAGDAWLHRWDAVRLATNRPRPPLSSSGYDSVGALEARRELLARMLEAGEGRWSEVAPEFHRSHSPVRGALSPCMHRDEAATVSLTVVEVSTRDVAMAYAEGRPCRTELGSPLRVRRASSSAALAELAAAPR